MKKDIRSLNRKTFRESLHFMKKIFYMPDGIFSVHYDTFCHVLVMVQEAFILKIYYDY